MNKHLVQTAGLLALLATSGCFFSQKHRNPFEEVEWREEAPGAGDRYVTFTPVLKADPATVLGPTVGADFAELYFEDYDGDGTKEAIVETSNTFGEEEFSAEKHVLKYQRDARGKVSFVLIKSENFSE